MLTLEPKSQSASRKSTMSLEIGMTGRPGSPLLILLRTVVVVVVVVVVVGGGGVVYVLKHLRAVIA